MAEKLKSVIRSPRFGLLLKVVIFWLLLEWRGSGTGVFGAVFFVGIAVFLYARPTFNALPHLPSFIVLMGMAFALPIIDGVGFGVVARLVLALLFYILLRLKEFMFIRRLWWHEALVAGLLYLSIVVYFVTGASEYFLLKHITLGVVFFLLVYELLFTHNVAAFAGRQRVAASALTLLFLEVVWAVALLPIGYASTTGVAALIGFVFLHLAVSDASGVLQRATVLKHVAFAAVALLLIALLSRWKP